MDEKKYKQFIHRVLWGAAGAILIGLILLGMKEAELKTLLVAQLEDAAGIDGYLQKSEGQTTALTVRDRSGQKILSCYRAHCGYDNVWADWGKSAKIWIVNGRVAQIQVEGVIKLSKEEVIEALSSRWVPYGSIEIGLLLGIFGLNGLRQTKNGTRKAVR